MFFLQRRYAANKKKTQPLPRRSRRARS